MNPQKLLPKRQDSLPSRFRRTVLASAVSAIFLISVLLHFSWRHDVPPVRKEKVSGKCEVRHQNFIVELHDTPCSSLGYSQGNQDCMLKTIFENLGTTNKQFVEYGFNAGAQCTGSGPNTCKLWRDGWGGLLLDGMNQNVSINLHAHYLYSTNIEDILLQYDVHKEPDFLSSDMDSHDFFVLASILHSFKPRVVTTEYNSNWPLGWHISQIDPSLSQDLWNISRNNFEFRQCIWGASASSLKQLMDRHKYSLIGVTPRLDLFWARNDLLTCFRVPDFSFFVPKMDLGRLHHNHQHNKQYEDWLIDTNVWMTTGDVQKAKISARSTIEQMISSGNPIPCFGNL